MLNFMPERFSNGHSGLIDGEGNSGLKSTHQRSDQVVAAVRAGSGLLTSSPPTGFAIQGIANWMKYVVNSVLYNALRALLPDFACYFSTKMQKNREISFS